MRKTMTSKERVLTTLARQEPDRVPINYYANPGIDARLKAHFGLQPNDWEGLLQALGVDFRGVGAPYTGPKLYEDYGDRQIDDWGVHRRHIEHPSGSYEDYCDFPLEHADVETVANWPMPSPDDFDYSGVADACKRNGDYAVVAGSAGIACIINTSGTLRTMEQALVDLVTDDPVGLLLVDRILGIQYELIARTLEAAKGGFDILWLGEDLGTQIGPIISMKTFDRHIRPRHQRFIDLGKSFGVHVIIHTCGSSSWSYDAYAEMGVSAVDMLQPEARNMAPAYLKRRFGDRLAFHGCISTTGPVSFGTVDDVTRECRQTLSIMMPGGGYCFAPSQALQDDAPTENVVAMYACAAEDGRYR
jgi:uroporphyrinogen decarboxylase